MYDASKMNTTVEQVVAIQIITFIEVDNEEQNILQGVHKQSSIYRELTKLYPEVFTSLNICAILSDFSTKELLMINPKPTSLKIRLR